MRMPETVPHPSISAKILAWERAANGSTVNTAIDLNGLKNPILCSTDETACSMAMAYFLSFCVSLKGNPQLLKHCEYQEALMAARDNASECYPLQLR